MSDDQPPLNRRRFFREGLRHLIRGVADSVEGVQDAIESTAAARAAPSHRAVMIPPNVHLRPPGALPESQYLDTCTRCGDCVKACPVQCIRVDPTGKKAGGAPYIDPDTAACSVCEFLSCMDACPSGALVPIPLSRIRMGTAVLRDEACIRTKGEECRICVEKCPLGTAAIDIVANRVEVNPLGCTGCGSCQHYCPTSPKSIVVIPVAARG